MSLYRRGSGVACDSGLPVKLEGRFQKSVIHLCLMVRMLIWKKKCVQKV